MRSEGSPVGEADPKAEVSYLDRDSRGYWGDDACVSRGLEAEQAAGGQAPEPLGGGWEEKLDRA